MKYPILAALTCVTAGLWVSPLRADVQDITIVNHPGGSPTWIDGMLGSHHSLTASSTSLGHLVLSGNNTFLAFNSNAVLSTVILTAADGVTAEAFVSLDAKAVDCSPVTFCNEKFTLTFETFESATFAADLLTVPGTVHHLVSTGQPQDLASLLGTASGATGQENLGILVTGPVPAPEPGSLLLMLSVVVATGRFGYRGRRLNGA